MVAAGLYKGAVDSYRTFVGDMDDQSADRHHADGSSLGTTLQVPAEMWPADRAAFDAYWQESLAKVRIDDTVPEYLYPIAASRMRGVKLPGALQRWHASFALLITTGILPQRFRDEMQLPWDADMQRRFDRLMARLARANHLLPRAIRRFPFNVLLKDLDWRVRTGRRSSMTRRYVRRRYSGSPRQIRKRCLTSTPDPAATGLGALDTGGPHRGYRLEDQTVHDLLHWIGARHG